MGIIRLLLIIALAVLLYRMWRNRQTRKRAAAQPRHQGRMLACEHCGLYLPEEDAVRDGGHAYCSEAHRRAHAQGPAHPE